MCPQSQVHFVLRILIVKSSCRYWFLTLILSNFCIFFKFKVCIFIFFPLPIPMDLSWSYTVAVLVM